MARRWHTFMLTGITVKDGLYLDSKSEISLEHVKEVRRDRTGGQAYTHTVRTGRQSLLLVYRQRKRWCNRRQRPTIIPPLTLKGRAEIFFKNCWSVLVVIDFISCPLPFTLPLCYVPNRRYLMRFFSGQSMSKCLWRVESISWQKPATNWIT